MNVKPTIRAFTIVELLIVIAVIAVIAVVVPLVLQQVRSKSRQQYDLVQVRSIQQGMVVFANQQPDNYPLPSQIDGSTANPTSDGVGVEKDTTRNIVSLLIFNQAISPELCVSPSEMNPGIKVDTGYTYDQPAIQGPNHRGALWDPSFMAYPDDAKATFKPISRAGRTNTTGGFSYAHVVPFGGRRKLWSNSFNPMEAVIANRGPTYTLDGDNWTLDKAAPRGGLGSPKPSDQSNTLRIHGGRKTWEGNVAYNDNHASYETSPDPETVLFTFGNGTTTKEYRDNLFVAESNGDLRRTRQSEDLSTPEGMNGSDNYLRGYVDVTVTDGAASGIKPFFD